MRIQTTFLATLLIASSVFAANCAAQTQPSNQIQTNYQPRANQVHSSRFNFEAESPNSNSNQLTNQALPIASSRRSLHPTAVSELSRRRTNDSVAANFETSNSNDLLLSQPSTRKNSTVQHSLENTHQFQTIVESPSSRPTNIFGIDEDQCCDEWENFTVCGGLKTNPGHYGIPWLNGKDNCETQHGCGCSRRKSNLGCGTSDGGPTEIESHKLKGITSWFKKSNFLIQASEPVQSAAVEYVQER